MPPLPGHRSRMSRAGRPPFLILHNASLTVRTFWRSRQDLPWPRPHSQWGRRRFIQLHFFDECALGMRWGWRYATKRVQNVENKPPNGPISRRCKPLLTSAWSSDQRNCNWQSKIGLGAEVPHPPSGMAPARSGSFQKTCAKGQGFGPPAGRQDGKNVVDIKASFCLCIAEISKR